MMNWMDGPLKGLFTSRILDDLTTQPVELIPFDLSVAIAGNLEVDSVALTVTVAKWLEENFEESVAELNYKYNFGQVVLRELIPGKREESVYTVTYEGMSFWGGNSEIPSETAVLAMQLQAFLNTDALVAKLQAVGDDRGLGSAVVDARLALNRDAKSDDQPSAPASESLDAIIVAAIVIAVLASILLLFALVMAWRTGRSRKDNNYQDATEQPTDPTGTGEHTPRNSVPTNGSLNTAGPYHDSLISEDISTSLSAYYKQGMSGGYKANRDQSGGLNDAASVSSMESYGYSLDGYASSIANN